MGRKISRPGVDSARLRLAFKAYKVTYAGHGGWDSILWVVQHSLSYRTGLTALIAFVLLVTHSVRPLRHAFYETFLTIHRFGVVVAVYDLYLHLAKHALPQLPWSSRSSH